MKKRLFVWSSLLLVLTAGLVTYICTNPPEPLYGGKKLGIWLGQWDRTAPVNSQASFRLTPEATEAVRRIGTNGIPTLLRKLEGRKVNQWTSQHLGGVLGRMLMVRIGRLSGYDPMSTIVGFRALGTLGKPAIPGLIARLRFDDDVSPVVSLCWIGPEGAAAFTNAFAQHVDRPGQYGRADILVNLAQCVKDLGSNATPLKPFFIERLQTDPSNEVRAAAVDALENVGITSEQDISVLASALKDREGLVRLKASMALSKLGPAARSAVPALLDSLKDQRQIGQARTEAINAIKAIAPEAATNAGLK